MGAFLSSMSKVNDSTIHFTLAQESDKAKAELVVSDEGYLIQTSTKPKNLAEAIKGYVCSKLGFGLMASGSFISWSQDEKRVFAILNSLFEDQQIALIQKASHNPSITTLAEWEKKEIQSTFVKASEIFLETFNHPQEDEFGKIISFNSFKNAIQNKYKELSTQLTETVLQSDDELKKVYYDSKIVELRKKELELVQRLEPSLDSRMEKMEKLAKEILGGAAPISEEIRKHRMNFIEASIAMDKYALESIREEIKKTEKALEPSQK